MFCISMCLKIEGCEGGEGVLYVGFSYIHISMLDNVGKMINFWCVSKC